MIYVSQNLYEVCVLSIVGAMLGSRDKCVERVLVMIVIPSG